MSTGALRPSDIEAFATIGVLAHMLAEAGVRRVSHAEAGDVCGIRYRSDHLEGIAFPYLNPADDAIVTWRVRRDHPEVERDGSPIAKYVSPPDRKHLYFVSGAYPQLTDPSVTVIIVEAEKSVLAIDASRLRTNRIRPLIVGTGGCWGWKGVRGKVTSASGARVDEKGPIPDLDLITWTNRDTIIVFDANVTTNPKVQAARKALAAELEQRGARVRVVDLPIEDGVNGPDDYLGKLGDGLFWTLVDTAKPIAEPTRAKRDRAEKPKQGREVELEDPEPWPTAVDGATLLGAIVSLFEKYLALPKHASTALALWTIHAYAFDAFYNSPFLAITSPVKRCGKTLTLIVLGALVPRRLIASNVTPAVLFRAIEKYAPTLLIDEADTFVRDNDELRGVMNSGSTRTTAVVIRAVGEDHDPRAFSTWCPKAIALIGKLPGTLADRSIEVSMRRRTAGEAVTRLRQDRIDREGADFRRQAARWAVDHLQQLQDADPDVPGVLHDRAADCWRPLLAIADATGGIWPTRARDAAIALSGEPADDDAGTMLLTDIRAIFNDAENPEVMASSTIVEQLVAIEDRPWSEWSKGKPITTAKLARMLSNYAIHPAGNTRFGAKVVKGYRFRAFTEAWERYLGVLEPLQRNKLNESGPESPISNRYTDSDCSGLQRVTNPMNIGRCSAVAASRGCEDHPDLLWRDPDEDEVLNDERV